MDPQWHRDYSKSWYERNKEHARRVRKEWQKNNKEKQKGYGLKQRHGISLEDYRKALEKQEHRCALCYCELFEGKNCHLDHCHSSGKFRGFLCQHCNQGLGAFKDNPDVLKRAIDYLESAELDIKKIV